VPTEHPKLRRAIERNLHGLSNCILKRRAHNKFYELGTAHGLDFFRIAIHALYNDLFAEMHRSFDTHSDAASIWYVQNLDRRLFDEAAAKAGITIKRLEELSEKTRHIRDRVHFHIDRRDLAKPESAWHTAELTGDEVIELSEKAHEILRIMYRKLTGEDKPVPNYYAEDVELIVRSYKKAHSDAPLTI
jgi:hypothetical protein